MPTRSIATALCLLFWICAESACYRRDPAPPGLRATLKTWNIEAQEKTVEEVLPWYQASTDDETKLARSFATQTISTARLLKAVRAKWGHDPETVIAHLCFTETPEDDNAATVTALGDHATLKFGDLRIAPLFLVKSNGSWRVDMAQYISAYGARLPSVIKYCDRSSEAFDKLTGAINAGEISTAKDAINALKTQLATLNMER